MEIPVKRKEHIYHTVLISWMLRTREYMVAGHLQPWSSPISPARFQSQLPNMMTSSHENIFRVTGPLCGGFTGHRWIPHTKASDANIWCFSLICAWINGWVNNPEAVDLRRHRARYDVNVTETLKFFDLNLGNRKDRLIKPFGHEANLFLWTPSCWRWWTRLHVVACLCLSKKNGNGMQSIVSNLFKVEISQPLSLEIFGRNITLCMTVLSFRMKYIKNHSSRKTRVRLSYMGNIMDADNQATPEYTTSSSTIWSDPAGIFKPP